MIIPNVHDQYSRLFPLIWRQNSLRKWLVDQLAYSDEYVAAIVVIIDRFARQKLDPLRFFFNECVDSVDMTRNRRVVVETAGEGRIRVPSDDFLRLGHPYAIFLINMMPIVWPALIPVMIGVDPEHFLAGRRAPFNGVGRGRGFSADQFSHKFFSGSNSTIVKRSGDCPSLVTFDRCQINRDSDLIRVRRGWPHTYGSPHRSSQSSGLSRHFNFFRHYFDVSLSLSMRVDALEVCVDRSLSILILSGRFRAF